jgi:hypothetical protein
MPVSTAVGLIPPQVIGLFASAAVGFVFESRVESCEALADEPPRADYQRVSIIFIRRGASQLA